ncbi:MAG: efflux RND transporter periplasmic adaptor subunit [Lysobacterales bacterium]|jgi:RND family efflux transporter MFP subunit
MNWKTTLLICAVILLLAAGTVTGIFLTEPEAKRSSAIRETAMLVEVTDVERGTFRPTIVATGTVRPEQEIVLSPRVSGEIVAVSDAFVPGGFVSEGELLLRIDPADYEATLLQRRSELRQATAELQMELGRQELARKDYQELKGTISSEYETLVLRKPQLDTSRALVESAESAVRRAELDLERTSIRAPFDAHILNREADIGSQVSPGQSLGRLVGVDTYWVETTLPVSDLRWIELPQDEETTGSPVRIRNRAAWPPGTYREGEVFRLIGALENQTRMARVLLTVSDPLAHAPRSDGLPPLMVGSFVEVRIEGKPIEDVVRVKRDYLRKNDTVWVNDGGQLRVREVQVVFRDPDYAYIGAGLSEEDRVVTTNLSTVVDGAPLRLEDEA